MGSFFFSLRMKKLLAVLMTDKGWFNSWATPVDISPRVAILLAWMSCCSASRRLVTSLMVTSRTR
jgi:hypothetical protein